MKNSEQFNSVQGPCDKRHFRFFLIYGFIFDEIVFMRKVNTPKTTINIIAIKDVTEILRGNK